MLRSQQRTAKYQWLVLTLRLLGTVDLLAWIAVVMPFSAMARIHDWAGLGEMPAFPIVGYLARSASALYALFGVLILYVSFDIQRYWKLIRFFACLAMFHGVVIAVIDVVEGMPRWWTICEGPCFAILGGAIFAFQWRLGPTLHKE